MEKASAARDADTDRGIASRLCALVRECIAAVD